MCIRDRGYTSAAGSTLVTFAQRDGMMLICVVMNEEAPSQFLDTATLLDYGFANFRKVDMSEYGQGPVSYTHLFAALFYSLQGAPFVVLHPSEL